ncbi:MAG: hypothetical protein JW819_12320 [Candidatus Krumholzibacteriota bacterium]|nr:hypothetical protein [Candidatus Krumholzibacteriota bacterium]
MKALATKCALAFLVLLALAAPAPAAYDAGADPVFRAMAAEMDRSLTELVLPGMAPPYFLAYRVQDSEEAYIEARYGALTRSERGRQRYLYIELRAGGPELDNTWFAADWRDVYNMRDGLVEEDDVLGLRRQLWLLTDAAYKKSLENLAGKQAWLASHPRTDSIPDFAPAECVEHFDAPAALGVDMAAWERRVREAAAALQDTPALQDWSVSYNASTADKRYLNSEGGRHLRAAVYRVLDVSATAQAADGQRLSASRRWVAAAGQEPPADRALRAEVESFAGELAAMAAAEPLDGYAGPVLFTGDAAAALLAQLFVNQILPARSGIGADDYTRQLLEEGKLVRRLNRRVFPDFVTVRDEPARASWGEVLLAGYRPVDDESVRAEALTLVAGGRLVNLPMSRRPAKKLGASNGHAYTLQNQWTVGAPTNLIVSAKKGLTEKKLLAELRRIAREFDLEYGLLVERLEDPAVAWRYRWSQPGMPEQELLSAPVVVYKVYTDDGRLEPARGLVPDDVTVRALRDVTALGKEAEAVNLIHTLGMGSMSLPISIVTPAILVEEMTFKAGSERDPLPFSPSPLAGDGR